MNSTTAVTNFKNVQQIFSMVALLQVNGYQWKNPPCIQDGATYDFIVVGGGTAGCVIASRLAALKDVRVLLIEAGGNPPFESEYASYFGYLKESQADWNFLSTEEDTMRYHQDKLATICQGKMLGGSSSLNYMCYIRGNPKDYNNWAKLTNDSSWAYKEVLPLFKQSEKMIAKSILDSPADSALYGTEGKIKLIKFKYHNIINKYFSAFEEMGIKSVVAVNSRNPVGVSSVLHSSSTQARQSTAYSFLRLEKNNANLDVLTNTLATKIIFDDSKNAVGVEIKTNDNKTMTVKAKKEVIVSCGSLKTPQLLMLSGIGPQKHLQNKYIDIISDLPVGNNLQDHQYVLSVFKMGKRNTSVGPLNPRLITIPSIGSYIAVNRTQKNADYESFSIIIDDPELLLIVCRILFSFSNSICDSIINNSEDRQLYLAINLLQHPKSRGSVRLNSTNIEDQPIVKFGYYSNPVDIETQVNHVMDFNNIVNTTFFKSVNAEFIHPELETCTALDKQSIDYWKCYCLGMVTTGQYYAGTCAMGTVVDSELLVKDTKRLRVVDASIMPTIVSYQTAATVVMIAQKAADMIIKKHSLE